MKTEKSKQNDEKSTKGRKQRRKIDLELDAANVVRLHLPYGLRWDEKTGQTEIFNRKYYTIPFCGQTMFDINPEELNIRYTSVNERCVDDLDGTSHLQRDFYLYNDATRPHSFEPTNVMTYILNLYEMMKTIRNLQP